MPVITLTIGVVNFVTAGMAILTHIVLALKQDIF
jgi:hypothetical protein